MSNKSKTNSKASQAALYESTKRWEKNRIRKLIRLALKHPNNKQLGKAVNNVSYRRKTPKNKIWSKTKIKIAGLFKKYVGKVDTNIFNNNEKISIPAHFTKGIHSSTKYNQPNQKTMFSLGERVRHS